MVRIFNLSVFFVVLAVHSTVFADDPIVLLKQYFAKGDASLANVAKQPFASVALSKEQAAEVADLLRTHHRKLIRQTRAEEMKSKEVPAGDTSMRFGYRIFGEKPKTGRSLYFSLHGGGGTAARINDSQWENQKQLYQPEEGVYLAPRAPANTWNLWHIAAVDAGIDRLIENLIALEDVNPNRVYLMGYSAGGDGVYQLAPRMADRFAAASMMAGHPNESSPRGLRNLPFSIHVGERDSAYDRNKKAEEWGGRLAKLREGDPQAYIHSWELYKGMGHWMNREDRKALPWMAKFTRDPFPQRIVWKQDDVIHTRFYWLAMSEKQARDRSEIIAEREGQAIRLNSNSVTEVMVRLNDHMLDLDKPVTIAFNGKQVYRGTTPRTVAALARTLAERGDPASMFSAEVTVSTN